MSDFRNDQAVELLATWIEVIDATGQQLAIKEGWHNLEPWPIEHPELSFQQTDDFGLNLLRGNFVATTSNIDRKSTRLNSSHSQISYAVFCLKKKVLTAFTHTR